MVVSLHNSKQFGFLSFSSPLIPVDPHKFSTPINLYILPFSAFKAPNTKKIKSSVNIMRIPHVALLPTNLHQQRAATPRPP
jgi:hypothetical protein